MSEYLDTMSDSTAEIRTIAYRLQMLSSAFYTTGNTVLAEDLGELGEILMITQKSINDAVSIELNDRLNESRQSSINMVSACLAGIGISKPKQEDS